MVAPTQPPRVRTLDTVFLRSTFQQVRSADAEIQAGLEAVLKLQLEAAAPPAAEPELESAVQEVKQLEQEAQKAHEIAVADVSITEEVAVSAAPIDEVTTAPSAKAVETPEPSLAEVAEAVFLETQTPTASQPPTQEPPAPAAEAASIQTGTPEVTKEVLLDSSGPQVTASDVAASDAPASNTLPESVTSQEQRVKVDEAADAAGLGAVKSEFAQPQKKEVKVDEAAKSPVSDGTVSGNSAQSESPVRGYGTSQFTETLDDLAAQAAAAEAANSDQSQDAFVEAVLKERMKASEPKEKKSKQSKKLAKKDKKDTLVSAVDRELARRKDEILESAEQAEAALPTGGAEPSRMPRNVQAIYLQPLRRVAKYGVPSCDLQMRSYSVRPLESFCDFALRAAYYCGLPAYGPVPLPKIIERWTVPKSSFIFKKSQENFERITRRRLIQIRDGHPQTVQMWLAFLQKHQQAAVGMKANVWEFSSMGKSMLFNPLNFLSIFPVESCPTFEICSDIAPQTLPKRWTRRTSRHRRAWRRAMNSSARGSLLKRQRRWMRFCTVRDIEWPQAGENKQKKAVNVKESFVLYMYCTQPSCAGALLWATPCNSIRTILVTVTGSRKEEKNHTAKFAILSIICVISIV